MIRKTSIVLFFIILISACQGSFRGGKPFPSPSELGDIFTPKKSKESLLAESEDQAMTESFLEIPVSPDYRVDFIPSSIKIDQQLVSFDDRVFYREARAVYMKKGDSLEDPIARRYKAIIKARGHRHKVYKGIVGQRILEARIGGELRKNKYETVYKYDLDYAFIEFDNNNRMYSALVRAAEIAPFGFAMQMGDPNPITEISRQSYILFASDMRVVEPVLANTLLKENETDFK